MTQEILRNRSQGERERQIFGEMVDWERPNAIQNYREVHYTVLENLIEGGHIDPDMRQNGSPSIQEFVEWAEEFEEEHDVTVYLEGYVVSPERRDDRVSVTTVRTEENLEKPEHAEAQAEFRESFSWADDYRPNGFAWWD